MQEVLLRLTGHSLIIWTRIMAVMQALAWVTRSDWTLVDIQTPNSLSLAPHLHASPLTPPPSKKGLLVVAHSQVMPCRFVLYHQSIPGIFGIHSFYGLLSFSRKNFFLGYRTGILYPSWLEKLQTSVS